MDTMYLSCVVQVTIVNGLVNLLVPLLTSNWSRVAMTVSRSRKQSTRERVVMTVGTVAPFYSRR